MSKSVKWAFWISGALAVFAFYLPRHLQFGPVMLAILSPVLVPVLNGYLYVGVFLLAWFGLRRISRGLAVSIGSAAVIALAWAVPAFLNSGMQAALLAARHEIIPAAPIGPAQTIALQHLPGIGSYGSCDDLCQTLLYNRVADRVIVLVPPMAEPAGGLPARTPPAPTAFRIAAAASCSIARVERSLGINWTDRGPTIAQAVRQRIAGGECLVGEPAPDVSPDLTIRRTAHGTEEAPDRLALRAGRVATMALEILAGDQVVARIEEHRTRRVALPLHLRPYGGGRTVEGLEWARHDVPANSSWSTDMVPALRRVTRFDLEVPRGTEQADLRRRIDAALTDPARPASDGAFALVRDYFEAVRRHGPQSGDLERLLQLVGDDRVTTFSWFPTREAFGTADSAALLREALLDRLVRLSDMPHGEASRGLQRVAGALLPGTLREPDHRVDALLAPVATRGWYPALIRRLGDRGPASVHTLLAIIRDDAGEGGRRRPAGPDWPTPAALEGLCLAGDPAALPALRQMQADETIPATLLERDTWRALFVRLGAPVAEFNKPANLTDTPELYRQRLERDARRLC